MALGLILNFLYPPRCAGCEARLPLESRGRICAWCLEGIERIAEPFCLRCGMPFDGPLVERRVCGRCLESPPYFRKARSVARYEASPATQEGALGSIIRRHKYGFDQSLSLALAECLGDELPVHAEDYDLVVPVPLHRRRLRWRGFNQAALLAHAVARRLKLRLDVTSLVRTRHTPPQTEQDLETRRSNVHSAFSVRHPSRLSAKRLLLVDDVMTTGATANECARVLLAAGARAVDVLTLARVL